MDNRDKLQENLRNLTPDQLAEKAEAINRVQNEQVETIGVGEVLESPKKPNDSKELAVDDVNGPVPPNETNLEGSKPVEGLVSEEDSETSARVNLEDILNGKKGFTEKDAWETTEILNGPKA